jgi:hypothetical protein
MGRKMDITDREAFAVREFCVRYGICRDTFYAEVRRGRLRALKLGKKTIVPKWTPRVGPSPSRPSNSPPRQASARS